MSNSQWSVNILTVIVIILFLMNIWLIFEVFEDKDESEEIIDSDGDGFADDSDAFPNHPDMYDFIVRKDTTWTVGNGPYIITEDLIVNIESTLTIEPGVTVKLDGVINNKTMYESTDIKVFGSLYARGETDNKITFTGLEPGKNIQASGIEEWGEISLEHTSYDSVLNECIIEYGYNGIVIDSDAELEYNIVRNCSNVGIALLKNSNGARVVENIIEHCRYGITGTFPENRILRNTIRNNKETGMVIRDNREKVTTEHTSIHQNEIINNSVGMELIENIFNKDVKYNLLINNEIGIRTNINRFEGSNVSRNSILGGKTLVRDFYGSVVVQLNYWGLTNKTEIENLMEGNVIFDPWLDSSPF